jgi:hypothetical protein
LPQRAWPDPDGGDRSERLGRAEEQLSRSRWGEHHDRDSARVELESHFLVEERGVDTSHSQALLGV